MDPDMVRQQEEAEEEARRLKKGVAATVMAVASSPVERQPLPKEPETETVMAHIHAPGLPPVIPVRRKKRPTDTRSRIGWFVALRVSVYALIMALLGLLSGIMVGVTFGLTDAQSLGVGAGIGFLLGWQSAFVSMRSNKAISFAWAMLISIWPALIVLIILVAAMLTATYFTGIHPDAMAKGHFWLIASTGALVALLLSTLRTRKLTVR